jgi:hypothetical protein
MGVSTTITGARCLLKLENPNSKETGPVVLGMFTDVSWGQGYSEQELFVLGRYSAADIVYTAANTINVSATGYRAYEKGAFQVAGLPTIQELAAYKGLTLEIEFSGKNNGILKVFDVKPIDYSSRVSARGVVEMTINFKGITATDESDAATQNDDSSAAAPKLQS